MLSRHWLTGRRRGGRRNGETTNVYVDCCTAREAAMILALLALAVIDWAWTLMHLRAGVEEANPWLHAVLVAGGVGAFTAVKLGLTLAAGAFLMRHVRFRITRLLLPAALVVYSALLVVHAATSVATASV